MYRGGRKLQRGFASILTKNAIGNMYCGGRRLQRGFASVLNKNGMRKWGWKEAPERLYITSESRTE